MNEKYPPKIKVKIAPESLSPWLSLSDPVELEARIFLILEKDYNDVGREDRTYLIVTDEIKFPCDLLDETSVDGRGLGLKLRFEKATIEFYPISHWLDMDANREIYLNMDRVLFFIEGEKILKGDEEVLKNYGVSISKKILLINRYLDRS